MKIIFHYIFLLVSASVIVSCQSPDGESPEIKAVQNRSDSIQKQVDATAQAMRALPQDSLLYRLHDDSRKGREPFNSTAYRELIKRKDVDLNKLRASINTSDRSSILNLLALRALGKEQYRQVSDTQKIAILTDALAKSRSFNLWGLPNQKMEAAAHALIEIGEPAAVALQPFLNDCRAAQVWGDEEYQVFKHFQFRLCDYAMVMIKRIREKEFTVPENPAERDKLIESLKQGKNQPR
jgi:hypothetical protein